MGEQAAAKVCVVCGKDVTNSPRVKDDHDRYMCKGACEAKARQSAGAAPARAADAGGLGVMAQLIDQSPMSGATPCGNCGNPMPKGQVVCLRCGFDVRTGRTQRTRVTAEKQPKSQGPVSAPRRAGDFGPSFGVLFLISAGLLCGLAALGAVVPPVAGLAFFLALIFANGGYIWAAVVAFHVGETKLGIYAFIPLLNLIFFFWAIMVNTDKWSRSILVSGWVGWIVSLAVIFGKYGGFEGMMKAMGP
jgi:hypothetical protein